MASSSADPVAPEVLPWLKTLPLAPEYHPTLAEFQDPISYILKIEKEASKYGICKIVPPIPAPPKKTTISNLNRSFAARSSAGSSPSPNPNPKKAPTFTTRQQQIGFCPRRPRPVQKPVWQSGEQYTLQQFEAKAKQFERAQLKKTGKKTLSPLEVESLFWKACADKPFSVEYANDMPGSGFPPLGSAKKWREDEVSNVGETAWNMRGVSRAKGSLLKFMKEDIPGVTSPMVYVAMMFSWFAWHVEDHELHSLNYLHMGAGKTWYGVPRDAALAFEEVIRMQGYAGEVNPLVIFAILIEKTTVMSPEVLIGAGIPCCRLVQNAGEFVVTFPGSYHSGFSLGFNCGEAANIATPEWLRVAKEAAIRRASINYPPMVSHFQLLYELALSLSSRMPMTSNMEPRSSRLKDKMKGEGEVIIKELFVQNVIRHNELLHFLLDEGSSCVVLPHNTFDISLASSSRVRTQVKVKPRLSLGLCSREEALEASRSFLADDIMLDVNSGPGHLSRFCSVKGNYLSLPQKNEPPLLSSNFGNADISTADSQNMDNKAKTLQGDGLLDQGLLSCVTCGILSFACVAVVQPTDEAARYLISSDGSYFNDQFTDPGAISGSNNVTTVKPSNYSLAACSGKMMKHDQDKLEDSLANFRRYPVHVSDQLVSTSVAEALKGISALDLLASTYGDSSDSEEEALKPPICTNGNDLRDSLASSPNQLSSQDIQASEAPGANELQILRTDCHIEGLGLPSPSSVLISDNDVSETKSGLGDHACGLPSTTVDGCHETPNPTMENLIEHPTPVDSSDFREMAAAATVDSPFTEDSFRDSSTSCQSADTASVQKNDVEMESSGIVSADHPVSPGSFCDTRITPNINVPTTWFRNLNSSITSSSSSLICNSDKDSARMHVFCLEHAMEVEKQLHPIGGVNIMLLCHPDYPKIEMEAKSLSEELEIDYLWKDICFREATKDDQERFQLALEDEEAVPTNSDWAVKMGINLYYSANLSKSPLYSKQMPYNAVIYKAFGCNSSGSSPVKPKALGKRPGRQKKIVVAGKWCGKVWMSNQVHPILARQNDVQEQEKITRFDSNCSNKKLKVDTDTVFAELELPAKEEPAVTTAKRSGRKRKQSSMNSNAKEPREQMDDSLKMGEDSAENLSAHCGRVLRSGLVKHRTPPPSKDSQSNGRGKLNFNDEDKGGPSTRLRKRPSKPEGGKSKPAAVDRKTKKNKGKKVMGGNSSLPKDEEAEHACDMEGCTMSFNTKHDLALHKRNICPVKGCGKKFFSHKYLVQHRRVHMDDRPLKCPWKGCKMSFKWAWARTEHIRVHTGARPYVCREAGCGQTFRFVSDFSRHKRKTGHVSRKGRG